MTIEDYSLHSYTYSVPEEQIAFYPSKERDSSRLLVLDRSSHSYTHSTFSDIFSFFPSPVLFVVNNSKVLPARFFATRATGAYIEVLLLSPLPLLTIESQGEYASCTAVVLLKGAKRCTLGEELTTHFGLRIMLQEKMDYGKYRVQLLWDKDTSLEELCTRYGKMPLPPYIRREGEESDLERYQSIFADSKECGSVASPTASLHCSPTFIESLQQHGSTLAYVTLYVGYGTFSPIRTDDIREHEMHEEYISITEENARKIQEAKEQGIPIVAIGTTALRVLESVMERYGEILPCSMMTKLYITPGYKFRCVDSLITNFHLPESSLLVLVSAFASRKYILDAYAEAVHQGYRFFSYGDAMLIK